MPSPCRRRPAFTVVEVLVVIGIITLLIGLLLPALSGVRKRMHKATEVSNLRQVGAAWTMYSSMSNDKLLPGYLEGAVQEQWGVSYRYRDGKPVPPAPDFGSGANAGGTEGTLNVAGPWPWRLMPYLDHNEQVVAGHLDEAELAALTPAERAWEIRNTPAFGYNGLFFGGWWVSPQQAWFQNARVVGSDERVEVVERGLGTIRRSSEVIVFGTAAERTPGIYRFNRARDDGSGSFMIQPPIFGKYELWGLPKIRLDADDDPSGNRAVARVGGDIFSVEYYGDDNWEDGPAPFG